MGRGREAGGYDACLVVSVVVEQRDVDVSQALVGHSHWRAVLDGWVEEASLGPGVAMEVGLELAQVLGGVVVHAQLGLVAVPRPFHAVGRHVIELGPRGVLVFAPAHGCGV